ncbi:hypothetical protein Tco_1060343 [Tanacetum coccineum]
MRCIYRNYNRYFNKSKLFGIGTSQLELNSFATTIGCVPSHFPCTYLGLPIGANMAGYAKVLIPEKTFVGVESRVLIPETTFLVVESRVLNPETTFVGVESRVLIPETTVWDTLVYPSDTLLYRRVSLFTISSPKQGGLGIGSLVVRNQDLLAKWWWRFLIEDNALWCKVIRSIHGSQGGLHDASLIRSKSGPWYRIAKLNEDLLNDYGINLPLIFKKTIGNREFTHFWLGGPALKETFPHIF